MNTSRQFVVQHHTGYGPEHWDLMLEEDDALATWRLHRHPQTVSDHPIGAVRIADHRKVYLTYEGPVRSGRGQVHIVDAGTYTVLHRDADTLRIEFSGRVLNGQCLLVRDATGEDQWTLIQDA